MKRCIKWGLITVLSVIFVLSYFKTQMVFADENDEVIIESENTEEITEEITEDEEEEVNTKDFQNESETYESVNNLEHNDFFADEEILEENLANTDYYTVTFECPKGVLAILLFEGAYPDDTHKSSFYSYVSVDSLTLNVEKGRSIGFAMYRYWDENFYHSLTKDGALVNFVGLGCNSEDAHKWFDGWTDGTTLYGTNDFGWNLIDGIVPTKDLVFTPVFSEACVVTLDAGKGSKGFPVYEKGNRYEDYPYDIYSDSDFYNNIRIYEPQRVFKVKKGKRIDISDSIDMGSIHLYTNTNGIYYRYCDVFPIPESGLKFLGWRTNGDNNLYTWNVYSDLPYKNRLLNDYVVQKDMTFVASYDSTRVSDKKNIIVYRTHIQSYGWSNYSIDGEVSGTVGEGKRLEGIDLMLTNHPYDGELEYRTHVQSYGWQNWVQNGAMSGTNGQSKRLEAIQIRLTGEMAKHYDVYYRVQAQSYGWLGWAKNGEYSGTSGLAKRLEAIQVVMVEKGTSIDKAGLDKLAKITSLTKVTLDKAYVTKAPDILYRTHVQSFGWQGFVLNGEMSGTSGKAKRLEGIEIKLANAPYEGGIRYKTHVQTYGWQDWKQNGAMSGTSGQAKRLEAISIELTGEMAKHYDVYYRVHAQSYGWLGWAKNGQNSGTAGYAKRLEGIQIVLVEKGQAAPGKTYKGITANRNEAYISK